MTDSTESTPPEAEVMPPENEALSMPPPLPMKKPGLLRRIFTSRKKQQAVAMQNGYLEMVDLARSIRTHLDRQEDVQARVLTMLEKVPDTMDRQHEVMTLFKKQLEGNLENDRKLTESMGQLNGTLSAMDESQKSSTRTVTDLIHRSRESEQLLREVMRRAERRMTILLAFFFLLVMGLGFYFLRGQNRPVQPAVEASIASTVGVGKRPSGADAAVAEEKAQEEAAAATAKADEQKKADALKQKKKDTAAKEKAAAADKQKKADELKAKKKAEEAKAQQVRDAKENAKKKQADELKAQKKADKSRLKAEKKTKAAAEKKAREAKEKADKETAAATPKTSVPETPEFTLERIEPAVAAAPADKPVSLP